MKTSVANAIAVLLSGVKINKIEDKDAKAALLKDYIQKDYTEVPKKSLIFIVAALLYLVNPRDIIPDKFIGVGLIDDAAVVAACIALTKADLDAYDAWKDAKA